MNVPSRHGRCFGTGLHQPDRRQLAVHFVGKIGDPLRHLCIDRRAGGYLAHQLFNIAGDGFRLPLGYFAQANHLAVVFPQEEQHSPPPIAVI